MSRDDAPEPQRAQRTWLDAPNPILPQAWRKGEHRVIPLVLLVCIASALASSRMHSTAVGDELIISFAIGLSSYSILQLIRLGFNGRLPIWGLVVGIPAGFLAGSQLAALAGAPSPAAQMLHNPSALRPIIVDTVIVATMITALFLYVSHVVGVKAALDQERRRAAEALHAETAARLALLQAQIEPHFLFNTLANIHGLIDENPQKASLMLEQLNSYLRSSLARTRKPDTTLNEELELVETLLKIAVARLGPRMKYKITIPPALRSLQMPPLLLQPLVENAIQHGIEPAVGGGEIAIDIAQRGESLVLVVTDNGVGLRETARNGVGLDNIRARLASLYGTQGTLALFANQPRGVTAKLTIPASDARRPL